MRSASTIPSEGRQSTCSRPVGVIRSSSASRLPVLAPDQANGDDVDAGPLQHLHEELVGHRPAALHAPQGLGHGRALGQAHREDELRPGGSDSTRVTAGYCAGRSSATSSTSMTRKAGRPALAPSPAAPDGLEVGHRNRRRPPTLRAKPTAPKKTSTAVPP